MGHDKLMSILCRDPIKIDHEKVQDLTFREVWEWFIRYHWEKFQEENSQNDPEKAAIEGAVSAAAMYGADTALVRKAIERDFAKKKRDEYFQKMR